MAKSKISKLVSFALSDNTNKSKSEVIGKVSKKQADIIKKQINVDLYNCERMIDTSAIRHTLKKHGSQKDEEKRGQIAINIDDFELVPNILTKAQDIKYVGKNKRKQDCFEYSFEDKNTVYIVEAVRVNKHGNKMVFETMYKRKKSNRKK